MKPDFHRFQDLLRTASGDGIVLLDVGGERWPHRFTLRPRLSGAINHDNLTSLPEDYVGFCTAIGNGGEIFRDARYGQWGFRLYGVDEIMERQLFWQKSLDHRWNELFLAFGESYGDANVLLFGEGSAMERAIREGSAVLPSSDWPVIASSFTEWLDKLVLSNGEKYWPH